jgi:hypothetical protein
VSDLAKGLSSNQGRPGLASKALLRMMADELIAASQLVRLREATAHNGLLVDLHVSKWVKAKIAV